MSAAHQQFSARTRVSGELEKPEEGRRKNLENGRLSVVFGKDLACVMAADAADQGTSAGGYARRLVLEHYEREGMDRAHIAARAAELRAARHAVADESPAGEAPAAVAI